MEITFSSLVVGIKVLLEEEVEVMNMKTQTMETLTRIPTGRRGMGVGVFDDRFIWTFGGFDDVIESC